MWTWDINMVEHILKHQQLSSPFGAGAEYPSILSYTQSQIELIANCHRGDIAPVGYLQLFFVKPAALCIGSNPSLRINCKKSARTMDVCADNVLPTLVSNIPPRRKLLFNILTDWVIVTVVTTIEKTFMDLMRLANSMDREEQRYVREGFTSDEELSLYDLLFSENLSKQDIQKIKAVAIDLLAKIKTKIAELDHWTDKQETRAIVEKLIRETLWSELPACYDNEIISEYRNRIYEYVYTRYKDVA